MWWCLAAALFTAGCGAFDWALGSSNETNGTAPAATAPAAACVAFVDGDGDGKWVQGPVVCPGQVVAAIEGTDCDDDDPTRGERELFYRDADGDGAGIGNETVSACIGEPPAGYVAKSAEPDCDDADAERQVLRLPDADGDGEGTRPAQCVGVNAEHFALEDGDDCDDTNAAVHHNQVEAPLDGVDSNCDGVEYPILVYPNSDIGELRLSIPEDALCLGEGLSIVGAEVWGVDVHGPLTNGGVLVVGNRGSQTVLGATLDVEGVQTEVLPTLAPRQLVRVGWFELPGTFAVAVHVAASASDGSTLADVASVGSDAAGPAGGGTDEADAGLFEDNGGGDKSADGGSAVNLPGCSPLYREGWIRIPQRPERVP
jgi:hypothetical protein